MSDTIIKVENLGKKYTITHEGRESYTALRDVISNNVKGLFRSKQQRLITGEEEEFWALKDVNFEIKQGDAVGIIGRNGAGKSTLLKILSRITEPSTGRITINGRVASLLEVGTGFHPELTGRENIYLNGAILGMSRAEIKKKFDEIVDFSGVEKFLDTPVKRYSSGMYVRLAFAVAAHLEPEILVVDEVLAVGDAEFQKKCLGKMDDVSKKEGRTVLFVSHDMGAINQLCNTGILLNGGTLEVIDSSKKVLSHYLKNKESTGIYENNKIDITKAAIFTKIYFSNNNNEITNEFYHDNNFFLNYELKINTPYTNYNVFITVLDSFKRRVCSAESEGIKEKMILKFDANFLVRGSYSIHTFIHIPRVEQVHALLDICEFNILDNGSRMSIHGNYDYGNVFLKNNWLY